MNLKPKQLIIGYYNLLNYNKITINNLIKY